MTRFTEFDMQLKARGWTFDVSNEVFRDGKRRLGYREVLKLVPGMTLDELASYVDANHDAWRVQAAK